VYKLLGACQSSLFHPHLIDDPHRLDAHARDALEEINHRFLVIREAVGVELFPDGRRPFLILVEDPFECGAVAQFIGPRLRRHPGQLCLAVELDVPTVLVRSEHRVRRYPSLSRFLVGHVEALEVPRLNCLVPNVQHHQPLATIGPFPEVRIKWNVREFALEVQRITLPIGRIVQDTIDIVEDGAERAFGLLVSFVAHVEPPETNRMVIPSLANRE
jgi:hypothetical protein